jgi:hypothetical protein
VDGGWHVIYVKPWLQLGYVIKDQPPMAGRITSTTSTVSGECLALIQAAIELWSCDHPCAAGRPAGVSTASGECLDL